MNECIEKSKELFERAVKHMPGGVNSPVRACQSVGCIPRFISRAEGTKVYDADGNCYTDYIGSWGPMLLGHNHPAILKAVTDACQNGLSFGAATEIEVEMAELLCSLVPNLQMLRMVNSGTEAVMSAVRVSRGFTGRNKIIKFAGCYHGHSDAMLVKAGSGLMTSGIPGSSGVPGGCVQDTLTAIYNDLSSVEELFRLYPDEIAAIIVEPVAANMGVVPPEDGFLQGLRTICNQYGALLIFDEVITGFRLGIDGAAGYYHVTPDLYTFGKIVGGGMPVGCYGGRLDIMQQVSPLGSVYQAGTLSGNPVAMAAGITQLRILKEHPEYYTHINQLGDYFRTQAKELFARKNIPYQVNGVGSLSSIFFTSQKVTNYETSNSSDTQMFAKYYRYMQKNGINLGPSQFESMFFSNTHTKEDIDYFLDCLERFLCESANGALV